MNSFITYAHRGASEYCPENTFMSFYLGVNMGANGVTVNLPDRLVKYIEMKLPG
jgi:glycerophosphoryl diester phosphodiesterase